MLYLNDRINWWTICLKICNETLFRRVEKWYQFIVKSLFHGLIFSLARYLVDIVVGCFFSLQYLHKKCQPFRERITNRCKEVTRPTKITEGSMLRRGASKWKFCLLFVWYLSVMSSPIKRHWRPIFLVREELLARVLISRERRWEHILSHLLAGN